MQIWRPTGKKIIRARLELLGERRDLTTRTEDIEEAKRRVTLWLDLERHEPGRLVLEAMLAGHLKAERISRAIGDNARARHAMGDGVDVLRRLIAEAEDQRLEVLVPRFLATLTEVQPTTIKSYVSRLRMLQEAGFPSLSTLTGPALTAYFAGMARKPYTVAQHVAQVTAFLRWCVKTGLLRVMPDFQVPRTGKPRDQWLDLPDVLRVVHATADPELRAAFALAYGGALEISAITRVRIRDLDSARRMVQVWGTKTAHRTRVARIEPWAWPFVEQAAALRLPNAYLVSVGVLAIRHAHTEALAACGLHGYHFHDARRSWCVRMIRAGVPYEAIRRQMGHANANMVMNVYGKFASNADEWDLYEANMASRRSPERGAVKSLADV